MAENQQSVKTKEKSNDVVVIQRPLNQLLAENPNWSAFGLMFFLTCIFFFDVLFGGKVFVAESYKVEHALSVTLKDFLFTQGQYPLWIPDILCGMPSFASQIYQPFAYYPAILFQFLDALLNVPLHYFYILHVPFAGLGVFLFLRDRKTDFVAALFGAIAFMFTPTLVAFLVAGFSEHMMTTAYLPLVFWSFSRLLRKGGIWNFSITALICGFQLQSGHIQICYYTWLLLVVYFLVFSFFKLRDKKYKTVAISLGYLVAIIALSAGLAAMHLLPVYEYLPHSVRWAPSALATSNLETGVDYARSTSWSFSPLEMVTFIIPSAFGFGNTFDTTNTIPFSGFPSYMGILVLLFAIFAMIARWKDRIVMVLTAVTVFALLLSFGSNSVTLHLFFRNYLPFFKAFDAPVLSLILVQLCISILAGMGLQQVINLLKLTKSWKQGIKTITRRTLYIVAGVFILAFVFTFFKSSFFSLAQWFYVDQHPADIQLHFDRIRFSYFINEWWLMTLWVSVGLLAFIPAAHKFISRTAFAIVILMLTISDLWYVGYQLNKPMKIEHFQKQMASDPIIEYLKNDSTQFRIFPANPLFSESLWAKHGIASIGGSHTATMRKVQDILDVSHINKLYAEKYYRTEEIAETEHLLPLDLSEVDAELRKSHQNLLNFLNVKYVLSPYPLPEKSLVLREKHQRIFGSRQIPLLLYENVQQQPRVSLLGEYKVIVEPKARLLELTSAAFEPKRSVVLDEEPNLPIAPDDSSIFEIQSSGLQELRVFTFSTQNQILVVADTHYEPGWRVTIDGQPAEILNANHAFRAVVVPAGKHSVHFFYHSITFWTGTWISIFSFLVTISLILFGYWIRKKNQQNVALPIS